jgi:hypothetical protein
MEKEQIQNRLRVTEEQSGLLEKCIADAKIHESEFDPRVYGAMIAQYESVRDDLKTEADKYRQELEIK